MAITKYHIGCTEWGLKEWRGHFFTDDAKPADFLRQYASVFNSVEGNTTFYHIPDEEMIQKWGRQTPDGFKFCFKFHRSITHDKQLRESSQPIRDFLSRFEPIDRKLGPFLIQLPPQFSPQQLPRLEATLDMLPGTFSYAVEVRHPDFYDHGKHENSLNNVLKRYGVNRVIFDTRKLHSMSAGDASVRKAKGKKPKVPVRFKRTASRPVVRFVGANEPAANESYLKEWAIIIADWIKEGMHPYIFTHTPDRQSQPVMARAFHQMLSELISINPMPPWPVDRQDEQMNLF